MQLTDHEVREFQDLWRKEFGEEISIEYARARASELIELYALLYSPNTSATLSESPEETGQRHKA